MSEPQPIAVPIETYRFSDVVALWARERLEHEITVARDLAKAVVCDGLRLLSIDDRWAQSPDRPMEFRGYPYVGYTARPNGTMSILRASALEHLFAIVERGEEPALEKLQEEFIDQIDFRAWLLSTDMPLPRFWYA